MKYTIEIGLSAMINMPSVIEIGSAIEKLTDGDKYTEAHTDTQTARYKPTFIF
jgi:hypothetical protein